MSVTTGLQLPFGIQPVNPVPVDAWSGPFTGSIDTVQSAVDAANSSIPTAIRFQSMEVRLIVSGTSRKFWYRDGIDDGDLVEFASGGGGGGTPSGSDSEIQFNGGGVFSSDPDFTYSTSTSTLTVPNLSGSLTRLADGTSYLVAGDNITITTGSNGSITISASGLVAPPAPAVRTQSQMAWMESPVGTVDGVNNVFTVAYVPNPSNSLMFFVNGVLQKPGAQYDYTLSSGSITLTVPPESDSNLVATYAYQIALAVGPNTSWMETPSGVVDGTNTQFVVANTPWPASALMFYVNGVLQKQGPQDDFSVIDKTIYFSSPPPIGSNLTVTYPY